MMRIYNQYGPAVVVLVPLLGLYRQRFCVIDASISSFCLYVTN